MTWIFVHICTLTFRYTVGNENTLTVEIEQDTTFQLQEEISESSEELGKIYSSLVRAVKIFRINEWQVICTFHSFLKVIGDIKKRFLIILLIIIISWYPCTGIWKIIIWPLISTCSSRPYNYYLMNSFFLVYLCLSVQKKRSCWSHFLSSDWLLVTL